MMQIRQHVSGTKRVSADLTAFALRTPAMARRALYDGARIVADELERAAGTIPTERFRYLRNGDRINVLTRTNVEMLREGLGIAKFRASSHSVDTSIGYAGYGPASTATRAYPRGTPTVLIARSAAKGTSVRYQSRYFDAAVERSRKTAERAMIRSVMKEVSRYG